MLKLTLIGALALVASGCGGGPSQVQVATVLVPTATSIAIGSAEPVATDTPRATTSPDPGDGIVTLAAVGDVMMARSVGTNLLANGPGVVFAGVRETLRGADLTFANVESAISDVGTAASKGYTFRAAPEAVAALVDAGVDVASLANNHALDFGPDALVDTRRRLMDAGIGTAGAGASATEARAAALVEREGVTFAFLAYVDTAAEGSYSEANWDATADSAGLAWASMERIATDVAAAKATSDIVVVSLHVGVEYSTSPSELQRAYAQAAIDAGATLVLGHHPHVLQPVEEYGGGLIAFSLGNFVFDGFDGSSNWTGILLVTFEGGRVAEWEMIPATVINGLPVLD